MQGTNDLLRAVAARNERVRRLERALRVAEARVDEYRAKGHTTLDSPQLRAAERIKRFARDDLQRVRGY